MGDIAILYDIVVLFDIAILLAGSDPTSNPTPFFSDFKDAKRIIFSFNLLADTISSVFNLLFLR